MRCKSNYPFRFREWCLCSLLTLGIGGAVSWLFYRSVYGMIGVVPLFFLVKRFMSNYLFTRKKTGNAVSVSGVNAVPNSSPKGWKLYGKCTLPRLGGVYRALWSPYNDGCGVF